MKLWVIVSLALAAAPACAAAASPDHVPGQVIVKFRHGVPAAERAAALQRAHAGSGRPLGVPGAVLARLPLRAGVRQAAAALERDPRVAWAQPDAYQRGGAVPNDPLLGRQWALVSANGPGIDAPDAWDHTTGSESVRVAIVDSGVNLAEPDLAPNIATNPGESGGGRESNGIDDDHNGFVDDWRGWDFVQADNDPSDAAGHGTHVSGIVAARGNNGLGVAGVAWHAGMIPVRVLDNMNVGTCSQIAEGLQYAVQAGARVVNLSLGSVAPCELERDVIEAAPDVLFVVAAMNDGADVDQSGEYPCTYPSANIVCVAATDAGDALAGFSNYGAQGVDLAAPGDDILSTFLTWGPKQSLFSDGFESALSGRWVTGGSPDTWGRSFTYWRSGSWSLSDSPSGQYANDTDNYAQLTQGLDLTGHSDCAASVYARTALSDDDLLVADTSPDGVTWGRRLSALGGSTSGAFTRWLIDLSQLEGHAGGGLRFRLLSNGSGTGEGVALDDLEIFCVPTATTSTGAPDEFAVDWGTSMAAPHVTGTAVLLLSLAPGLTAAQLKQVLLGTVDALPGLSGATATGGRLNAGRAVGFVADALAAATPPPPAAGPPARPAPVALPPTTVDRTALTADLRALARSLAAQRIRGLLRRGRVTLRPRTPLPPGTASLLVTAAGRPIATGRHGLTAVLTRRGRAALRRARRVRLSLVLTFTPRGGAAVTARAGVVVRR